MPVSAERKRELRQLATERRAAELRAAGRPWAATELLKRAAAGRKSRRGRTVATTRTNVERAKYARAGKPYPVCKVPARMADPDPEWLAERW